MAEVLSGRYGSVFSPELEPNDRERMKTETVYLALHGHLDALGKDRHVAMEPEKGSTRTSVANFFSLPAFDNPINTAALKLVPTYSYTPACHNDIETHIDRSGLSEMLDLKGELESARNGAAAEFIVAKTLNLHDEVGVRVMKNPYGRSRYEGASREEGDIRFMLRELAGAITFDLDQRVVDDIRNIGERAQQRGWIDFLSYLTDVKDIISERVELVFAHEAEKAAEPS